MPDSITVAAFVAGLVLVIAAFIGKELKIAAVEMPALGRGQRLVVGVLGVFLVVFGMTDGQWFERAGSPTPDPAAAATGVSIAAPTAASAAVPAAASASENVATHSGCFAETSESDRIIVPIENHRRTDRTFGSGQPREGVMVIEFSQVDEIIGGLQFKTHSGGVGFDLVSVVDGGCNPITTYENASRPEQPKDAPYDYDTLIYRFGEIVIAMDVSYGEGNGKIYLRAEQTGP
jgi:hypothetical protein